MDLPSSSATKQIVVYAPLQDPGLPCKVNTLIFWKSHHPKNSPYLQRKEEDHVCCCSRQRASCAQRNSIARKQAKQKAALMHGSRHGYVVEGPACHRNISRKFGITQGRQQSGKASKGVGDHHSRPGIIRTDGVVFEAVARAFGLQAVRAFLVDIARSGLGLGCKQGVSALWFLPKSVCPCLPSYACLNLCPTLLVLVHRYDQYHHHNMPTLLG